MAKKTRKFAAVKRLLNPNDIRLFVFQLLPFPEILINCSRKENQIKQQKKVEEEKAKAVRRAYVPRLLHLIYD